MESSKNNSSLHLWKFRYFWKLPFNISVASSIEIEGENSTPATSRVLRKNKFVSCLHWGSQKDHSTKLAATILYSNIRGEMDDGKLTVAVYLELCKDFGTIGHGVLLNELSSYEVIEREVAWFLDYLFNKTDSGYWNYTVTSCVNPL